MQSDASTPFVFPFRDDDKDDQSLEQATGGNWSLQKTGRQMTMVKGR